MSKKNVNKTSEKKEFNVKYYDMKDNTPDEIMDDYFATEEEAESQALKDAGFEEVGTYDPNNPEERDAVWEKLMAELANEPEFAEDAEEEDE